MLRVLVALLLVANLGFLALSRGWLAPAFSLRMAGEREPQRLAAQIDAQSIQVLAGGAASAALARAGAGCLQAGPFKAEQLAAVEAALGSLRLGGAALTRVPLPQAAQWRLVLARPDDAGAEQRLRDSLRADGFIAEALEAQGEQPRGWLLGRYDTREAAAAALADARSRGLADARLLAVPAGTLYTLRVAPVDAALRERLQTVPLPNAGFVPCGE